MATYRASPAPAPVDALVPARTGRPSSRRAMMMTFVALVGIIVLLLGGLVGAALFVQSRIDAGIERFADPFSELPDRPVPVSDTDEDTADPVNILVLGSDSRISAGDPSQWQYGAQRTDVIMIAQVSGDRQHAYLMSIPRDSWVDIPGHGEAKINAAFSFGGPALMVQTVEQLTGIRVDHFAIADFTSFATLTDTLGGVEIELTQPLRTRGGEVLRAGTHVLDGSEALSYARQRHGLSGGDFSRVQRQQNWMRAILRAAVSQEMLTDPLALTGFLEAVGRTLAVDEDFTIGRMRNLAFSMRDLRPSDVVFMTAPHAGTGWSPDGRQSIVNLDRERFDPLVAAFATDAVDRYLRRHPGSVVTLGGTVE